MNLSTNFQPHPLDTDFEFLRVYRTKRTTADVIDSGGNVAIVSMNRPRKRNAIHRLFWKEIGALFRSSRLIDDCRCVLLTAQGSSFSAGIDVTDPSFLPDTTTSDDVAHIGLSFLPKLRDMQDCFSALEDCPIPVVAAIHGNCIGAGVDLICAADIRVCTLDTVFAVREVALGLAADVGTLQRLPKIVGNDSWVREICLTGRNVSATEANKMGLVSHIYADKEKMIQDTLHLCSTIAKHSPVAVRGTKKALLYSRDHSVREGLDQIAAFNALALQGQDLPTAWTRSTRADPVFVDIPPRSRL